MKLNAAGSRLSGKAVHVVTNAFQPGSDWKRNEVGYTPGFILLITILGIAMAEIIAMAIIYFFRYLPYYQQVFLDAAVMTVIIFPLLYFLSFRPLLQHVQQRYQVERMLETRLRLIQFANTHTLSELLQYTLQEIELLTDSESGFFHFLNPDQKTLGLQAWSPNAVQNTFPITNSNFPDEMAQADIWTDCVRQRQPVIHNDSAALPFRKEMPEGHAQLVREMAVPVFRDEAIVAVLGLENKSHDFTKSDVELVSTLADFAWDIVKQKQAEWEITERNLKEKGLTQTIHTMQLDIARDLHDTVGQNISFLRMKLEYLSGNRSIKKADLQAELQSMTKAASESYDLIRGTLAVLQSGNSSDLFRLFSRYAEQIEERSGFKVDFSTRGESKQLSAKRLRQIFYVFREALNNIEKHACATHVSIDIDWNEGHLIFTIIDNGRGFDPTNIQYGSHFGLKFMRERVEMLNGSMDIRSKVGSGSHIIIQVPYA